MGTRLLILLFVIPLAETWFLIKVGGVIGAVPTIALVVLTALVGSQLLGFLGISLAAFGKSKSF